MDVNYPNGSGKKVRQAAVRSAVEEVKFKECGRNHALASGGHNVDGCGEWMPLGDPNPADASSYNCAACGCHRNFHRQVMTERSPPPRTMAATVLHALPQRREETPEDRLPGVDSDTESDGTEYDSEGTEYDDERSISPPLQPPPAYHPASVAQQPPSHISSARHSHPPGAPPIQRLPAQLSPATAPPPHGVMPGRKRTRTMFTAEQKLRMQELAERLGWRLHKRDKDIINAGCHDIGVSRDVFRVWMHNKKRKYPDRHSTSAAASAAGPSRHPTTIVASPVLE